MGSWVVVSAPCRVPVVLKEDPLSPTLESLIFEGIKPPLVIFSDFCGSRSSLFG